MKTAAKTTFPERVGRTLGRLWRSCVRLDRLAMHGLMAKGWGPGVARAVLLVVKLAALGALLYVTFWLALLAAFVVTAAWMARGAAGGESEEWEIGDQVDHKDSVFYDPTNYNDDPDHRFDEEQ